MALPNSELAKIIAENRRSRKSLRSQPAATPAQNEEIAFQSFDTADRSQVCSQYSLIGQNDS